MVDYTTLITFLMIALIVVSVALGWFISCRVSDIRYQNAVTRYLNQIEYEDKQEEEKEACESPKVKAVQVDINQLPEEMQEFLHALEEEIQADKENENK